MAQAREAAKAKYQRHANDVGSSHVQIAQLTETVNYLTKHVQSMPRDYSARRGLIRCVNLRRKCVHPPTIHTVVPSSYHRSRTVDRTHPINRPSNQPTHPDTPHARIARTGC